MKKAIKLGIVLNGMLIITILILFIVAYLENKMSNETPISIEVIYDTIPPQITLIEEAISVVEGTEYIEPSYNAIDNIDGDITSKVVVTNNIDINIPGNYEVIYEVQDTSNNMTKISREVIVQKKHITRKKTYKTTTTNNELINKKKMK